MRFSFKKIKFNFKLIVTIICVLVTMVIIFILLSQSSRGHIDIDDFTHQETRRSLRAMNTIESTFNLAYLKPVITSSNQDSASQITDGNDKTAWTDEYQSKDNWLEIDLKKTHPVTQCKLKFKDNLAAHQYQIFTSIDHQNWTLAYDASKNDDINNVQVNNFKLNTRYIKIIFLYPQDKQPVEIKECKIYNRIKKAPHKTIMVLAPHEDDEVIIAGGIIKEAVDRGDTVKVLLATNGDFHGPDRAPQRIRESVNALEKLGVTKKDILFLGYADTGGNVGFNYTNSFLYQLFTAKSGTDIFSGRSGNQQTYGCPGVVDDYHFTLTRVHADYTRDNFLSDLRTAIETYKPDDIYTTSRYDMHYDHAYLNFFTVEAILNIKKSNDSSYNPLLHEAIVHFYTGKDHPGKDHSPTWPNDHDWPQLDTDATGIRPYTMPNNFDKTLLDWDKRECVLVPPSMSETPCEINFKRHILKMYSSQYTDITIGKFSKKDEIFWTRSFGSLSYSASVIASSEKKESGQGALNVIDGTADGAASGLPLGYNRFPHAEWVSNNEKSGAWICLTWEHPQKISKIILYDRPNRTDHIIQGVLTFSDGSTVDVTALPDDGRALEVNIPAKTVTWVKLTITGVSPSTESIGLSEFEVFS